ncbi:hypothetical protein [Massilia sp. Se16.2.3]|uniref:hypothetical protein n=1 Tax=Massilia sp. Se16.2.3 TaxID=2709303 RepID=UPI001E41DF5E|nr:hypothetical protein [Massilia sp. Se16.2.3]
MQPCRQALQGGFLQHYQRIDLLQRGLRLGRSIDVAVEVGTGQDQHARPLRVTRGKGGQRGGRAARMQGDEQIRRHLVRAWPAACQVDLAGIGQEGGPTAGGVPVPVVVGGSSGADDRDAGTVHRQAGKR